jgi:2-dehydro-3-deoxy-D-arabinonate dehydratase
MKLYRTAAGTVLEHDDAFIHLNDDWDALVRRDDLAKHLRGRLAGASREPGITHRVLAPIGQQEVWAAGVTYHRSRVARLEESREAGGGSFYDRVYDAERPELFFKAAPWRVRGPGEPVRIRRDATWSVPEPEIALCITPRGRIVGYTIGNDMSSRDIEGENPLYLPQAKIYDGACALGPALFVTDDPLPPDTPIGLRITHAGTCVFDAGTMFSRMVRDPGTLVEFLYRETSFPDGCVLLTGTGVVPGDDFRLRSGDEISITVPPIGTLTNVVEG